MKKELDKTKNPAFRLIGAALAAIVRLCLRNGFKFQDLYDALKEIFLHEARAELLRHNELVSVSRLSILTGLQRKDITRLLHTDDDDKEVEAEAKDLTTKVIGAWFARPYLDANGRPRKLSTVGLRSGFAELVNSVSADLNHRTVLFELMRLKIVEVKNDTAVLKLPGFIVHGDINATLPLIERDVSNLIMALQENLTTKAKDPHLHATTEYDNIPVDALPKIKEWMLKIGRDVHAQARVYIGSFDRDVNDKKRGTGRVKVSLGTFSFDQIITTDDDKEK